MSTTPEEATEQPAVQAGRPTAYYAVLIGLYNALFGGFLLTYRKWKHPLERLTGLDMLMLSMSTLRLAKLISEDEITAVIREPVLVEQGGERRPQGTGLRHALGRLVLCPTCTGTWVAAFLTYALHLSPRYTRPLLAILSASGAEQFSDALLSLVYTDRDVLRQRKS